jgi:hypothetical protein
MVYVYRGKQPLEQKPATIPHPGSVLDPCGTIGAAFRHWKNREPLCEPCKEARRAYDREYKRKRRELNPPPPKPRKNQAKCGTHSGAMRHYKQREPLCEPCKEAKRAYEKQYHSSKPKKPRNAASCGTYSGSAKHFRKGEPVCDPCREARNAYQNNRNRKRMTSGVPYGTIHSQPEKAAA